jgi:hypothetical protein
MSEQEKLGATVIRLHHKDKQPQMPKPPTAAEMQEEWLLDRTQGEGCMVADGFEDALVGITAVPAGGYLAVYDMEKCLEVLETRDGMTPDDAEEYFAYNVLRAYVGPNTPLFIVRYPRREVLP